MNIGSIDDFGVGDGTGHSSSANYGPDFLVLYVPSDLDELMSGFFVIGGGGRVF